MSETIEQIRRMIKDNQIQQILQMESGRKLDALVAHYVMGYHVEQWLAEDGDDLDYWYREGNSLNRQDHEGLERVPNYSTAIYSAAMILPRFSRWRIHRDEAIGIRASFLEEDSPFHSSFKGSNTLPEALCKGALITLVEQNRIIDELLNE